MFPIWFISLFACKALFVVMDMFGAQFLIKHADTIASTTSLRLFQALMGCCVWIPYMRLSNRVKATFVR